MDDGTRGVPAPPGISHSYSRTRKSTLLRDSYQEHHHHHSFSSLSNLSSPRLAALTDNRPQSAVPKLETVDNSNVNPSPSNSNSSNDGNNDNDSAGGVDNMSVADNADSDSELDVLEFRLNHDSDSGVIRSRTSGDDGIPQVIRHSLTGYGGSISTPQSPTLYQTPNSLRRPDSHRFSDDIFSINRIPTASPTTNNHDTNNNTFHNKDGAPKFSEFSHQGVQTDLGKLNRLNSSDDDIASSSAANAERKRREGSAGNLDSYNAGADDDGDAADDDGWQDMKTVASYEVYDEKGKIIVHRHDKDEEEENGSSNGKSKQSDAEALSHIGAVKGYTRVAVDDDVRSVTSMDENTDFLFDEDELNRNPLSQLQATKDMLTDAQRIAYVGLCRVIISNMAADLAHVHGSRSISQSLSNAQGSMAMWGQKMMIRLYSHMDINPDEQLMIEQLGQHGVLPQDLAPSLMKGAKVKNPMREQDAAKSEKEAESEKLQPSVSSATAHDGDDENNNNNNNNENKHHDADRAENDSIDDDAASVAATDANTLTSIDIEPTHADDLVVTNPEDMPQDQMIEIDIRWTLLCDLFLVLISDSVYDSRSRTLMKLMGKELGVSSLEIAQFEQKVTDALEIEEGTKQVWDEKDIMESRRKRALKKKYMYVGLATLGGGLVIGLSAGLLAPVIGAGLAAGFTTIGVAGTSGFLAGAGGTALVTTTGVAVGARIGSKGMATRMGHVKTFEFRPLHNHKRVNVIVTLSGWMLGKEDDVRLPFSTIDPVMGDILSVLWEPEMLQSMGQTINILATEVLTQSIQQILGSTVLTALMASIQLPMVLSKLGYLLDNPWNVSLDRAWASGLILADTLINKNLGVRPVTLVGFSLGARVIYSCLVELARRGAYGLVEQVFIFGAPVVIKKDQLALARSVVSGRFVNGYSKKDWILGYLFRATSGGLGRIAGLAAVDKPADKTGTKSPSLSSVSPSPATSHLSIENFDCTDMVEGHMSYRKAMPKLLNAIGGWEVLSEEFAEIEDPDPERLREKQRQLIAEFDEARKQMEKEAAMPKQEDSKKSTSKLFGWMRPKKKEWWNMAENANVNNNSNNNNNDSSAQNEKEQKEKQSPMSPATNADDSEIMFDLDAIQNEVKALAAQQKKLTQEQKNALPTTVPFEEYDWRNEPQMSFEPFADDDAQRHGGSSSNLGGTQQDSLSKPNAPQHVEHKGHDRRVSKPHQQQELDDFQHPDFQENITMTFE